MANHAPRRKPQSASCSRQTAARLSALGKLNMNELAIITDAYALFFIIALAALAVTAISER